MNRPRTGAVLLALVTVTLGVVLLLTGTATPAQAHDVLISTTPAAQATIAHAPAQVVLTFDNPALQPGTALVVTGPSGPVQQGPPQLLNNTVTQPLRPGAPAGTYHVAWRATSIDGHPVSGQFTFTATTASTSHAGRTAQPNPVQPNAAASTPATSRTPFAILTLTVAVLIALSPLAALRRRSNKPSQAADEPHT